MENETKKKYHITVTDNETGETFIDCDTSAIIGAFDKDENDTGSLFALACTGDVTACTIAGTLETLQRVRKKQPLGYLMAEMILHEKGTEK